MLLHNGNELAFVLNSHSLKMKETHENTDTVLDRVKYAKYEWVICRESKVLLVHLAKQGRYIKYPCFLCLWDSGANQDHYIERKWQSRGVLVIGDKEHHECSISE